MKSVCKILSLLRPYWAQLLQALLAAILIAVLSLPGPYLTKVLIDDVYPHQDFGLLYCLLILGAAVSVVLGVTNTATGLFQQRIGIGMSFDFQSRLYRHLQSLDFRFYDESETGEIMARFQDMQSSVSGTVALISGLIINLLQLAVFPAVLIYINWRVAPSCQQKPSSPWRACGRFRRCRSKRASTSTCGRASPRWLGCGCALRISVQR